MGPDGSACLGVGCGHLSCGGHLVGAEYGAGGRRVGSRVRCLDCRSRGPRHGRLARNEGHAGSPDDTTGAAGAQRAERRVACRTHALKARTGRSNYAGACCLLLLANQLATERPHTRTGSVATGDALHACGCTPRSVSLALARSRSLALALCSSGLLCCLSSSR